MMPNRSSEDGSPKDAKIKERERRDSIKIDVTHEDAVHSPSEERKPRMREDTSWKNTTTKMT
jgi:hypothetical protein